MAKRLCILTFILAFVLSSMVMGMGMVDNAGFGQVDPAKSILIGVKYDSRTLASAKPGISGMAGYSIPIFQLASGGRMYGVGFGEFGKLNNDAGNKYKAEVRTIYFFGPMKKTFNVGFVGGIGLTWEDLTETPVTEDQTISYLLGTVGLVLTKPLSENIGLWIGAESALGNDYVEVFRIAVGLNFAP